MSDEVGAGEEEVEIEAKPKRGLSGKKMVLFIIVPLFLILGGGGTAAYLMGFLDSLLGVEEVVEGEGLQGEEGQVAEEAGTPSTFYDLPDMLVNLNSSSKRASYLKVSIALELRDEDVAKELEAVIPRIVDQFQVYLRELRVEDLQGSAGLQRMREELLLRVQTASKSDGVRDVLFREMLVQ